MVEPVVAVSGLVKRYADGNGVSGVDLVVNAGDLVGLVGANGGGKTTTLQMLAGLVAADRGDGTVLGEALSNRARMRRRRIGYMPQRMTLYPDLTVRENLRFRLAAHGAADATTRLSALVDSYQLAPVIDRPVAVLSGGWARRAQFAATVAHDPDLLLLDEPTAGLDAATRRDMRTWLAALSAAGKGVVVATHDLLEAECFGSIVLYEAGCASAQMVPAALVAEHGGRTLEAAILARMVTPT